MKFLVWHKINYGKTITWCWNMFKSRDYIFWRNETQAHIKFWNKHNLIIFWQISKKRLKLVLSLLCRDNVLDKKWKEILKISAVLWCENCINFYLFTLFTDRWGHGSVLATKIWFLWKNHDLWQWSHFLFAAVCLGHQGSCYEGSQRSFQVCQHCKRVHYWGHTMKYRSMYII